MKISRRAFGIGFALLVNAGLLAGTARADITGGEYCGVAQVWDVQRSPAFPIGGQPITLSSFNTPYSSITFQQVTLTPGQYVSFTYAGGACVDNTQNIVETLHNADGTVNQILSQSGQIYGIADIGFLYASSVGFGTFVTNNQGHAKGDSVTYTPAKGLASCADLMAYAATATPLCTPGQMAGGCTPATQCPAGDNCGTAPDGCGGTINCGTCANPQTCGGGGKANVCGCTPITGCAAGQNCGTMPDGCGGTVTCGTRNGGCASGLQCGGGGTANVCGCSTFAQLNAAPTSIHGDQTCNGNPPPPGTTVQGNLNVPQGATCNLVGVNVQGNVQVQGSAVFTARASVINGNVQAQGSTRAVVDSCTVINGNFQAQNTAGVGVAGSVHGNVEIQQTNGSLSVGNWICQSTIGGNLQLQQSAANASFDIGGPANCAGGNAIHGNIEVQQNQGAVTVDNNSAGGNIQCQQNTTITSSGNTAHGNFQGQCTH